jgi:hypothetical protein
MLQIVRQILGGLQKSLSKSVWEGRTKVWLSFTWWRVPQQMLRTHHSLKAFCATLWWTWKWAVFYQILQVMEHQWNEINRVKPTTRRKTCPSATLSTTNPTWTDLGSNPSLRSERPATNRLSLGTANCWLGICILNLRVVLLEMLLHGLIFKLQS